MEKHILQQITNNFATNEFSIELNRKFDLKQGIVHVKNNVGSFLQLQLMDLFSKGETSIFQVFDDKEKALYALNEVEEIFGKESVLFFPHSYLKPYEVEEVKNANVVLRSEVLNKLRNGKKKYFVVSYSDAIVGKVTTKKELKSHLHTISVGEEIDTEFLNELLFSFGFHRTDFVTQPGEFSLRGGIVDVFSFSNEKPYRLVFFGNEVEEIKEFDIETQLSEKKEKKVVILPNLDIGTNTSSNKESIFSYLKEDSLVVLNDSTNISRKIEENYYLAERIFQELNSTIKRNLPKDLYLTKDDFQELKNSFLIVDDSKISYQTPDLEFELSLKQQPNFAKNFEVLTENLKENREKGIKNYIVFQTKKQEERLCEIIQDLSSENLFTSIQAKLYEGFIDTESNCAVYTDHHIFERYLKFNDRTSFSKSQQLVIKELTDLKVGDFVTHIDYGIGKFLGLKKIDVNGKPQEAIKMSFLNDDILYVSVHSLHKISRYTSKDGTAPKLNKLGSPAWKNLKNKTKKRVKEVAFDLIKLYAKRKSIQGYSFSEDSYLQTELEASFQYEDTPDQEKATIDFKKDMESNIPMDRLVCGDVGFGKTEIAIRAAFKAVGDSKQVAILVPTTILAFQHYKTFSKRLNDFPVKIDYLNRFRSAKQKSQIIQELSEGKIDIIIGTHQLISQKIKFKDLGLLIVDEEHKFGVSVKDKLKTLRANLDTLTLTATPIPRTLQFSLMSARDLSIIKTPPPNRQPVDTILSTFNEETIRDAISYEMARDGQVFFINNRIENLPQIANLIQRLVPEAKIAIGHGQMEGKKIEDILLNFMEGNYDVLISTTIVESGLDVPNANTILINDAQRFGMADLHQMRGRVGRSNRKAFCYLLSPPFDSLTQEAQKRLQALEIFSDLGSGFQIAMKDLEIRGAGDLLGAEQSGFISDIGFDTYQKILNEAIEELKQNDFSDLFEEEETEYVKDVQIDTDLNVLIPDTYINKVEERFSFYQRLSKVENEKELTEIKQELKDRFGDFPKECTDLFTSVEIKWVCKKIGFERLIIKKNTLLAYFPESSSKFFESEKFTSFLMFIQKHPELGILKEKTTKEGKFLVFRKEEIKSLNDLKAELINYAEILN